MIETLTFFLSSNLFTQHLRKSLLATRSAYAYAQTPTLSCRPFSVPGRGAYRGAAKVSGPKIRVTNPAYTEVFERGYPPREVVPAFFQQKMNWVIREDTRGCKFLYKVRKAEV